MKIKVALSWFTGSWQKDKKNLLLILSDCSFQPPLQEDVHLWFHKREPRSKAERRQLYHHDADRRHFHFHWFYLTASGGCLSLVSQKRVGTGDRGTPTRPPWCWSSSSPSSLRSRSPSPSSLLFTQSLPGDLFPFFQFSTSEDLTLKSTWTFTRGHIQQDIRTFGYPQKYIEKYIYIYS